jgi:hypothetical protein
MASGKRSMITYIYPRTEIILQENEDDAKLKGFLRKPLAAIESIFVGLSQLVAYAKNQSTLNMQTELKDFERQLVKLVFSTRLGKWQGAMGRDEVVFTWRQLVSLGNLEGIYDEARQRRVNLLNFGRNLTCD